VNYVRIYESICDSAKKVKNGMVSPSVGSYAADGGEKARGVSDRVQSCCSVSDRVHLIIPGGIWGSSDAPDNTIYLTAHQQIVAYKLLRKIYPYSKSISLRLKDLLKERGKKHRKIPYTRRGHSAETRMKMSKSHTGKKFGIESRKKMSDAKRGRKMSAEHVANRSASRRRNARGFSAEAKINMSVAAKNRIKKTKWSVGK
jgi:hypothetical protein